MSGLRKIVLLMVSAIFLLGGCVTQNNLPGSSAPPNQTKSFASGLTAGSNQIPASVALQLVADNLTSPVALVPSPDKTGRLFIVDQIGVVYILTEGKIRDEPFLDLRSRMVTLNPAFDERGLLDLEFHPDFRENGRFFVYYSAPLRTDGPAGWDHTSHISEFKISETDPNKADIQSERIIIEVDQTFSIHNAGQLVFGPDGYLYISLGDSGPRTNGQDLSTLLGSVLRLDVDNGDPYGIPEDNPFIGTEERDEIFAFGFRNPYRMSFDAGGDRELFVGDVGEVLWEEISIVIKGGNFGWPAKEGTSCFNPDNPFQPLPQCPAADSDGRPYIDPIIEYPHSDPGDGVYGTAVIGGYIYRGAALPHFAGYYIFGDYTIYPGRELPDGRLFIASEQEGKWNSQELKVISRESGRMDTDLRAFGQDINKELYVLVADTPGPVGNTGKVFKIVP